MNPKIRQRVLSEFRGYWEPRPRPDRQKMVGEVLPALMEKLGLGERFTEQEMLGAWQGIVGEHLAKHSQPVRLRRGVLEVIVTVPVIHYELDRKHRQLILRRLQERFGRNAVQDLRFVLG
jgi:predicted nucleic acid-binding Zn ribbon protein